MVNAMSCCGCSLNDGGTGTGSLRPGNPKDLRSPRSNGSRVPHIAR